MGKNKKDLRLPILIWPLSLLAIYLFTASAAFGHWDGYSRWHMGPWMMGGWGTGWFGMIFMMVFWGLVIVGLILLVKWLIQSKTDKERAGLHYGSRAMEILKERYVRGEINRDQFESMKKDLLQ